MTRTKDVSQEDGGASSLFATRSTNQSNLRFAFDGSVGEVLHEYFQRDASQAKLSRKFKLYYRLRPFIPIPLRQLLQRGRNGSMEVPGDWFIPRGFIDDFRAAASENASELVIHPWPDGEEVAVSLTHDVETAQGLKLVDRLAAIEEEFGLRSAWNIIPFKYGVDQGLLKDLQQRGHEIGVHGYNHDGRLFESERTFRRRASKINETLSSYGSSGFRAPMVHRNLDWLQQLEIEYDASCFDVDPFQAMPGGVGSVWPFMAGRFVELPYTLPQDHTLLVSLGETTPRIWIEKFNQVRRLAGMAMLITHPDYLDTPKKLDIYRAFLEHLVDQPRCWHSLPQEIADWWRQREELEIVDDPSAPRIVGEQADRARFISLGDLQADSLHREPAVNH